VRFVKSIGLVLDPQNRSRQIGFSDRLGYLGVDFGQLSTIKRRRKEPRQRQTRDAQANCGCLYAQGNKLSHIFQRMIRQIYSTNRLKGEQKPLSNYRSVC
ncbi:MAG TPA: hypothetical protein VKM56_01085, partial [Verrucomicrobiae bacterium]|nr:hypothetical protein [Verrucomicrobiae bacterium]